MQVATHSGPFHADDVLAWALITEFVADDAELVRTRDKETLAAADVVFDVGGIFDPDRFRFDHHQSSYEGPLSSAGMVLNWLEDTGRIDADLATQLRSEVVDYVDAVDNGRAPPQDGVPCFPKIVDAYNQPATHHDEFDAMFRKAGTFARQYVQGLVAGHRQRKESEAAVLAAMKHAEDTGSNVIHLDRYHRWKEIYFHNGGEDHPTEYVLFPGTDETFRVVAIPPRHGDFGQKRPLPEAWAGLSDGDLAKVTGVDGSVFCHKNRFIAVFQTKADALTAMKRFGILDPA